MINRLSNIYKILVATIFCTVIYNEFLCYVINSWSWPKLECNDNGSCARILLIADPQLIGEFNENYHFATPLTIWDSDRYLLKTYSSVVKHVRPNVIIFLGDLFDEGLIASRAQFHRYTRRFFRIFNTEYPAQYIWLPGDNDIGGEAEDVSSEKMKIFNHTFVQNFFINYKFITFTKLNRMVPMFQYRKEVNNISIALSHMPLILIPGLFVDKVLEVVKPKIIFSGHEHKSMIVDTNMYQTYRKVSKLNNHDQKFTIFDLQLDSDIVREIIVPTCSYRMGTTDIGYGVALINESGAMKYTVLWSPSRFTYLYAYLFLLIILLLLSMLTCLRHCEKDNTIPKYGYSYYRYKILKNGV